MQDSNFHFHPVIDIDLDFSGVDKYSYFSWMKDVVGLQSKMHVRELIENYGLFQLEFMQQFFDVDLKTHPKHVQMTCSCEEKTFCIHQKLILQHIFRDEDILCFFKPSLKIKKLHQIAAYFGLPSENDPEKYVELFYKDQKQQFRLKNNHLISLDELIPTEKKESASSKKKDDTQPFLLLKKHKFYKHLEILLCEAPFTKQGKPKNPVEKINYHPLIWNSLSLSESQFFSALQQWNQLKEDEMADVNLQMDAIVRNPRQYPVYLSDATDSTPASSLKEITSFSKIDSQIEINITIQDEFYVISANYILDGKTTELREQHILFQLFIENQDELWWISSNKLRNLVLQILRHQGQLLLSRNYFAYFKNELLDKIADFCTVNFAFIKKDTTEHSLTESYYQEIQPIIYLDQSQDFIHVLPVMRYKDVEIPVRSKRQIFGIDRDGHPLIIQRWVEKENELMATLLRQHPYWEEQMEESFAYFYLHQKEFLKESWFQNTLSDWLNKGYQIFGIDQLKTRISPFKGQIHIQVLSGKDWFNAKIKVSYGPKSVSLKKLEKAIRNKSAYVELNDGTKGVIPMDWFQKLITFFEAGEITTAEDLEISKSNFLALEALSHYAEMSMEVQQEIADISSNLKFDAQKTDISLTASFKGQLRNYQKAGVNWLYLFYNTGIGVCLADDMGLGKTIQVIALLNLVAKTSKKPHLLVVPSSLIFNWQREINTNFPDCSVYTFKGTFPDEQTLASTSVILLSYHQLVLHINQFKRTTFDYILLDESQYIKNPTSQRYLAVTQLKSNNRLILTGTPFENSSMDLYAQFNFLNPGFFGSKKYFNDVFLRPIDGFDDRKRTQLLNQKIKPFILRRTKDEVLRDIPPKTEHVLLCKMKTPQRKIYDLYEREFRDFISVKDGEELLKSPMHVLKGLTTLRQICDSPQLLKVDELSHQMISAKIEILQKHLSTHPKEDKIVVFSQFVRMLKLIQQSFQQAGIKTLLFTGETKNRSEIIDEFQTNKEIKVLLISLKAGGTGLNLTAANILYLVDPWWNPAAEQQAIDRVYRIGQTKPVKAFRLITPNSVEEKIQLLQEDKLETAKNLNFHHQPNTYFLKKNNLMKLLNS